jgi:hypothetical protein
MQKHGAKTLAEHDEALQCAPNWTAFKEAREEASGQKPWLAFPGADVDDSRLRVRTGLRYS